MGDLFLLSVAQMRRIAPCFPFSHGIARVGNRRVISGIIFVIKSGLRWRDAPSGYGPHKTDLRQVRTLEPFRFVQSANWRSKPASRLG